MHRRPLARVAQGIAGCALGLAGAGGLLLAPVPAADAPLATGLGLLALLTGGALIGLALLDGRGLFGAGGGGAVDLARARTPPGGLAALHTLLRDLDAASAAGARTRSLERACRKVLRFERFELVLSTPESDKSYSVYRAEPGTPADERPEPAAEPDADALVASLGPPAEAHGAIRLRRAAPPFGEIERLWLETVAAAATPWTSRDREDWALAHDATTGTIRAGRLWTRLEEEVRRARRYAAPLSLLWILPDPGAKPRGAGDPEAAEALLPSVRDCDLCARVEPGAFVVLLPGTGPDGARAAAERLRRRLTDAAPGRKPAIGFAWLPDGDERPSRAMARRAESGARRAAREGTGVAG